MQTQIMVINNLEIKKKELFRVESNSWEAKVEMFQTQILG